MKKASSKFEALMRELGVTKKEFSEITGVKGVTISTLQVKPSEGAFVNGDKTKLH